MTRYFEVLRRDGPARSGRLLLKVAVKTPAILQNDSFVSVGSIFDLPSPQSVIAAAKDAAMNADGKLVILPYVPSAPHAFIPVRLPPIEIPGPTGIVIHPMQETAPQDADCYVAPGISLLSRPRELVGAMIGIRALIPPDSALFTPAAATPSNLAFLVYLGADLVDDVKVVMDGYYGRYHTRDGVFLMKEMHELPCSCRFCQELSGMLEGGEAYKFGREQYQLLAGHNTIKLQEEISRVRELIHAEGMREYVERQVRVTPLLTAALRLLDGEGLYLEKRTPTFKKSILYANTAESLSRVEVTRFAKRVLNRYKSPQSDVLLLLPCSAKKPYSRSRSHRMFAQATMSRRRYLHEVILTSPLALVPRELEEVYPAASYDVPVTGHWDLEERAWIWECLDSFLEKNRYSRIVAHVEGELKETVEGHGLDAIYTGGGTSAPALERLAEAISEACRDARRLGESRLRSFHARADYFFGTGAGETLFCGQVRLAGHEVRDEEGKPLVAETINGTLALSLHGARRLAVRKKYIVHIGNFCPMGTVLAPGVTGADEQIRPGDEVIVSGERSFGVGKAKMSGWEMVASRRGVAVDLRHVEEV